MLLGLLHTRELQLVCLLQLTFDSLLLLLLSLLIGKGLCYGVDTRTANTGRCIIVSRKLLHLIRNLGPRCASVDVQLLSFLVKLVNSLATNEASLLLVHQAFLQSLFVAIEDLNLARQKASFSLVTGRSIESLSFRLLLRGRIVYYRLSALVVGRFMACTPSCLVMCRSPAHLLQFTNAGVVFSLDYRRANWRSSLRRLARSPTHFRNVSLCICHLNVLALLAKLARHSFATVVLALTCRVFHPGEMCLLKRRADCCFM